MARGKSSKQILLGAQDQEARNAYFGGSRLTNSREAVLSRKTDHSRGFCEVVIAEQVAMESPLSEAVDQL
jgi:hypothetical protein